MAKKNKKPEPKSVTWFPLGNLNHGFKLEATYLDGVVILRGAMNRAEAWEGVMDGDRSPRNRILSHEAYALTRESVNTLHSLFPKKG